MAENSFVDEDIKKVSFMRTLAPENYANLSLRAHTVAEAERAMASYLAVEGLSPLDSPVGKWHEVIQDFDGEPWVRWEYRLFAWAVPRA